MEKYDYSGTIEQSDQLSQLLDTLSKCEITAALQAISEAKQTNRKENERKSSQWFEVAILPVLKDFAEMTSSILEIDRPQPAYFVATLSNEYGFDITESCRAMRFLLNFSNHIGISKIEKNVILTLMFDLSV